MGRFWLKLTGYGSNTHGRAEPSQVRLKCAAQGSGTQGSARDAFLQPCASVQLLLPIDIFVTSVPCSPAAPVPLAASEDTPVPPLPQLNPALEAWDAPAVPKSSWPRDHPSPRTAQGARRFWPGASCGAGEPGAGWDRAPPPFEVQTSSERKSHAAFRLFFFFLL